MAAMEDERAIFNDKFVLEVHQFKMEHAKFLIDANQVAHLKPELQTESAGWSGCFSAFGAEIKYCHVDCTVGHMHESKAESCRRAVSKL